MDFMLTGHIPRPLTRSRQCPAASLLSGLVSGLTSVFETDWNFLYVLVLLTMNGDSQAILLHPSWVSETSQDAAVSTWKVPPD